MQLLLLLALLASPHESKLPVELKPDDRISLLGNALAERMQHHGWMETRLQHRLPDHRLSFRNLGFSADELTVQQRTSGFWNWDAYERTYGPAKRVSGPGTWDAYLRRCETDVLFAFFGFCESFAGEAGLPKFEQDLRNFVAHVTTQQYNGSSPARLVLFSSIPFENHGDPNLGDGAERNRLLRLYGATTRKVAQETGVGFVDLFTPMQQVYQSADTPLTLNGIHLTETGNRVLAGVIESALIGDVAAHSAIALEKTRTAVLGKNLLWFNRYRATDGFNVYGGRSGLSYTNGVSNYAVLQRELEILDVMADNRDRQIQARANGGDLVVDDSNAPPAIDVITNKPGDGPEGQHTFLDGTEAIEQMTPAAGMKVELFADEKQFPALENPVQMAFDTRGRLWVAVWPTYPHWAPGQPMNDKLLILEDLDHDGRADVCKEFASDLHNPTGFEFWNGGVYVANAPDLLFLKDTDGDDRADVRERVLHGLSSADTHHAANSFVVGPGGAIYFQEGTFHQSQVETPYGPVRNNNGCVWRFEPKTYRAERYVPYNFANPHGHVFDRWGQDFVTDGTGNVNYYALPFSGHVNHPTKHSGYFPFFRQRSRPCAGTEILSSTHFPDANQGNYLICNVIGFLGLFQYEVLDDGSGFRAEEVEPIVFSSDQRFRPSDAETAPDGSLYFLDWSNPIIGHMQHHLRDPSRDHDHGRVYRVTYEDRPLQPVVTIGGAPIDALLEQLKSPADRVRARARSELSGRSTDEVLAAAKPWLANLDKDDEDYEHHLLEGLWLHQQHNRCDQELLRRVLQSPDPRARAAATRVLRCLRHLVDDPVELLHSQALDGHPRVRLEAVVAASFFTDPKATGVALAVLRQPTDKFLDYALKETMKTLDPIWQAALREGRDFGIDHPSAWEYLLERVGPETIAMFPRTPDVLQAMLTRHGISPENRLEAAQEIAKTANTSAAAELFRAAQRIDTTGGMHAGHILHDLTMVLSKALKNGTDGVSREQLATMAAEGTRPETRALGTVALSRFDGGLDQAWTIANTSRPAMTSFLQAIPMIEESQRATLYDRLRPMMFRLPQSLENEADGTPGRGSPGVNVRAFGRRMSTARLEAFDNLEPDETHHLPNFRLAPKPANTDDAYALIYEGTLHIPRDGEYELFTNSDDGSMLYLDGRLVVENDGSHGMRERGARLNLSAGPHAIVVSWYDQAGGDGLIVSWKGPGIAKEEIPQGVLSTRSGDAVRASAIRALAHVAGPADDKFKYAAKLIGEGTFVALAVGLLEKTPRENWSTAAIRPVISSIAAHASGLPKEQRTTPAVLASLEIGNSLAGALPDIDAKAAREMLSGLGGTTLLVRTLPHQMLYDRKELTVKVGSPVAIVFQNNDLMPHNLVITQPGKLRVVGEAAEALQLPADGGEQDYVPETAEVLWATGMLLPGDTTELRFVAPETPGDYPYVCTFPGHWRVMNGILHVVEELDDTMVAAVADPADAATASVREFVQMWTMDDLKPALADGWDKSRDLERGRHLMRDVGCTTCHTFEGQGANTGPDLSEIGSKYQGEELLSHIVDPSSKLLEGYLNHFFVLNDGTMITGKISEETESRVTVIPNLQRPDEIEEIDVADIEDRIPLDESPMPNGLLVTMTRDEILDLLALLQSAKGEPVRKWNW